MVKCVRKRFDRFYGKTKVNRNVNFRDLGCMAGDATAIYIKRMRAVHQCQITFTRFGGGRNLVRKNKGDRVIVINGEEDLGQLR